MTGSFTNALLALGVLFGVMACGGAPPQSHVPQPLGWTSPEWRSCPDEVIGAGQAQCALLAVPLNWDAPSDESIAFFVRKVAPEGPVRGQLWAFAGGPGDAGDAFLRSWFHELAAAAGYELIIPTHRGTAYGTALDCPGASELGPCAAALSEQWGQGLRHFGSRMAARDVAALAAAMPLAENAPRLAFGGSYGTVWLQRVLEYAPETFDAVYMDSTGTLDMNFARFGEWGESVGRELLERCASDEGCGANFSDSPREAAARVLAAGNANAGCFAALGRTLDEVKGLVWSLLQSHEQRALIAPLLLRLDRCTSRDQEAIQHAFSSPKPAPHGQDRTHNGLHNLVVTYSELYQQGDSLEALTKLSNELLFEGGTILAHHRRRAHFPRDLEHRAPSEPGAYEGVIHIVQGSLDPLTPKHLADGVVAQWPKAQHDTLFVPWGGHASPRFTQREGKPSCTELWLTGFLEAPSAPFDRPCLDEVRPLDIAATSDQSRALATEFFGTPDVWNAE